MSVPLDPRDDPEATFNGDVFFDAAEVTRQVISRLELLARLSRLMQSYEGCEHVRVIDVTRLERQDEAGCNWSSSIVLATGGVSRRCTSSRMRRRSPRRARAGISSSSARRKPSGAAAEPYSSFPEAR